MSIAKDARIAPVIDNKTVANDALISRQAILNAQEELIAYEFSLQPPVTSMAYDRSHAAALVCATYAELGIRTALGEHAAFLRIDLDFLHDDAIEALPADSVVLELVLTSTPDERALERCRSLRDRHYSLALADYTGLDERSRPLLSLLDIIKIDIQLHDPAELSELAGSLSKLPIKLLAQGVHTQAELARCQESGFQLFQGNYFARSEIVSGRRLSPSQAGLIQLINLAGRDADTAHLEDQIKREPALAANLLRIVNSVGHGVTQRVSSLNNAIIVLGRRQLQRWLQLLLMTPAGSTPDTRRSPLLQVAALRGRMMEILIESSHPRDHRLADQSFITGIMSMMPAALGLPMAEIFEQIKLEPEITQALLSYEGTLGAHLTLVEAFDAEDIDACNSLLTQLPKLNRSALNNSLIESLRWVNGNDERTD